MYDSDDRPFYFGIGIILLMAFAIGTVWYSSSKENECAARHCDVGKPVYVYQMYQTAGVCMCVTAPE